MDLPLPIAVKTPSEEHLFSRLFLDHPHSVGEGYWEHQRHAFAFAATLVYAAAACLLHSLVPVLCVRTGSRTVARLYDRMVVSRRQQI
jgi:hypothetical protein